MDIGDLLNASELISGGELGSGVLTSRPIRSGVKYVEVTVNAAWHGTRLALVDADSVRTKLIGTVNCKENKVPSELAVRIKSYVESVCSLDSLWPSLPKDV